MILKMNKDIICLMLAYLPAYFTFLTFINASQRNYTLINNRMCQKEKDPISSGQSAQKPPNTIYFRCANKQSYKFSLGKSIDLESIKNTISESQQIQKSDLQLIYQGKQFVSLDQLKPKNGKCIVHIVNLARTNLEELKITLNFAGKFKDTYSVAKNTKIKDFMDKVKVKHKLLRIVLINLGAVLKEENTFNEERVENNCQIYATGLEYDKRQSQPTLEESSVKYQQQVEKIKETNHQTIVSSQEINLMTSGRQKKMNDDVIYNRTSSKDTVVAEKDRIVMPKDDFIEPSVPLSDVFDLRKHYAQPRIQEKQSVGTASAPSIEEAIDYKKLKLKAMASKELRLCCGDLLFSGEQSLPETNNFLRKTITEYRSRFRGKLL